MEILIIVGGCYALYTVGMAIATELDYRAVNRERLRHKPTISVRTNPSCKN